MTQFDYIVIAILAISGIVGFIRGAAREVVTVLAFLLAAMAAMFGLRFAGPIARATLAATAMKASLEFSGAIRNVATSPPQKRKKTRSKTNVFQYWRGSVKKSRNRDSR